MCVCVSITVYIDRHTHTHIHTQTHTHTHITFNDLHEALTKIYKLITELEIYFNNNYLINLK